MSNAALKTIATALVLMSMPAVADSPMLDEIHRLSRAGLPWPYTAAEIDNRVSRRPVYCYPADERSRYPLPANHPANKSPPLDFRQFTVDRWTSAADLSALYAKECGPPHKWWCLEREQKRTEMGALELDARYPGCVE